MKTNIGKNCTALYEVNQMRVMNLYTSDIYVLLLSFMSNYSEYYNQLYKCIKMQENAYHSSSEFIADIFVFFRRHYFGMFYCPLRSIQSFTRLT